MYGFKGTVLVKEGDGFANTVLSYDDVHPGRRFTADRLVPFVFTLKDFRATYAEDGKALTFDADVDWARSADGAARRRTTCGSTTRCTSAPRRSTSSATATRRRSSCATGAGNVLPQTVPCLPQDARFVSSCTIKVPNAVDADGAPDQLGFEGVFTPTTVQDPDDRPGQLGAPRRSTTPR